MSQTLDLFVPLADAGTPLEILVARHLGREPASLGNVRLIRRALDARKGRPLGHTLRVEVGARPESSARPGLFAPVAWPTGRSKPRVVVIGSGPAGTFAALRLCAASVPTTVLERGKPVQPRRHDLAAINRGRLDPQSNYCFGEGGAGTYSDGKLYTRTKDRQAVEDLLAALVRFGAPPEIVVEARPHIGSNRLPKVLTAVRTWLEEAGVSYRFETEAAGLRVQDGAIRAVRLAGGDEVQADAVVLAIGHSARDAYAWLHAAGVPMARKPFALGLRIEHPQPVIDRLQYGRHAAHPALPPAFYELKCNTADRAVYSFCMCPGGWIVPAATEEGGVVVNGMSLSRRDSPFANSGFVVEVRPEDFGPEAEGPLAGVAFQRRVETAAFVAGGGRYVAPAQRLEDFLAARPSTSLPRTSYHPGLAPAVLDQVLPPFVTTALRAGLSNLVARLPGYRDRDAVLVGVESRTSAPVRILRDPVTRMAPGFGGLYPVGEGAGYAGGIVSAALDGIRAAEAIMAVTSS